MPESLWFTNKDDHDKEEPEEQVNIWTGIRRREENDSFLTLVKRLCTYWRRILFNKIRLIFTLIFMSMLNITTRITCFMRQPIPPSSPSTASFTTTVTSSSLRTLEEDLNDPSQSLLLIDNTHKQAIDLPSIPNSKMAHILVQQQQIHRSPSISIHPSTSTQKESKLPMTHSVDDRLFLHGSTQFQVIHFLTRFASEPQMTKYQTQSTNSHGHFSQSSGVFALSKPVSNSYVQVTEPDKDEIHFEDIFYLNCDKIQPVSTISSIDDFDSDKLDNIITTVSNSVTEQQLTNDEGNHQQLDEDNLVDTSPSINNNNTNDLHPERHFRRRKRRSSLTKTSITIDDTPQPTVDLLEKLDINQQQSQENREVQINDHSTDTNGIETKHLENEESNEPSVEDEKPASVSRYRGRRLRHRFYRHAAASTTSPPEVSSNTSTQFYLPDEALNVEAPRNHSSAPSSPVSLSPLPASLSPTLTFTSNSTSSNSITGGLKRITSAGITKKNVRFADSVGRELAQVQYIHSPNTDELKELSFLLGSSPPSFTKNNLYLPNTSRLEHKPWSFDVALTANQHANDIPSPRRFFCLFRQPNSEHPDIYLHDVWKSQIKLEHADIPPRCSSTGEQQLVGTLWVTNASYWKYVSIKYSFNRWLNTCEYEAHHRCHSNDFRNIDLFEFTINLPADVDRIDFVLRYCVNGQEHWDNNEGKNYTLQTESAYTPSTTISLPHDCDFNEMRFY